MANAYMANAYMANDEGLSLKEAALKSGYIDEKQFDKIVELRHSQPRYRPEHDECDPHGHARCFGDDRAKCTRADLA